MRKQLKTLAGTFLALALMDFAVETVLTQAGSRIPGLGSLVRFFDYGRSVPGKLAHWTDHPNLPGNLYDVAWRSEIIKVSARNFATAPAGRPVVRGYGMSFVNQILEAAQKINPTLELDLHSGPGAPPNFTYATFLDDRANRRAGDVAVLGILSSSIAAMAAMTNRTWVFEQPAPFTYPIFHAEGDTLRRIDPLINSAQEERSLSGNPKQAAAWREQLRREDPFYSAAAFSLTFLDHSPFARLVRRSLATNTIDRRQQDLLADGQAGPLPYAVILRRMVKNFARVAKKDRQIPVVVLIQTRDANDPDVFRILAPTLTNASIPYVATTTYRRPTDQTAFLADGHYTPDANIEFGQGLIDMLTETALHLPPFPGKPVEKAH